MNAQDKQHLESLIHSARVVVRETGSAAQLAESEPPSPLPLRVVPVSGALYNHIMHAYDMACAHLQQLDPAGAAEFIRSTYGPAFRQTEVKR